MGIGYAMSFLENINWKSDDGVFFPMLVDFRRNQYYDEIIADSVAGKDCIDLGFGTGMLSMMALKHGARHIIAYEKDVNRYHLGCYIIQQLGLENKIDLRHEEFSWKTTVDSNSVIISETVNSQLWAEGLWDSIPRTGRQTWLPGSVFMDVIAEPIPAAFANDLFRPAEHFEFFNPAVDLDEKFVSLVNQLSQKSEPVRDRYYHTDSNQGTVWGGWTYVRFAQFDKKPVAGYQIDLGTRLSLITDFNGECQEPVNSSWDEIELVVELPNSATPILVVPRVGFKHNTKKGVKTLILDTAESWGGGCQPLIVTNGAKTVTIKHNVRSGLITYLTE